MSWIQFIPIGTFLVSVFFSAVLYKHWNQKRSAIYVLWWLIGVLTYAAGTLAESVHTIFGFSVANFKFWYITGALLGGAPLAQGTVYLLMQGRTANLLTAVLVASVVIASAFVILSPVDASKLADGRLSGIAFEWQWVRNFSPFINSYAVLFLVGGAFYSAFKYFLSTGTGTRFWGNLMIAIGAILPGIGGSFTRLGHVEVLYVTEFVGLSCIIAAYAMMRRDSTRTVHEAQRSSSTSLQPRT